MNEPRRQVAAALHEVAFTGQYSSTATRPQMARWLLLSWMPINATTEKKMQTVYARLSCQRHNLPKHANITYQCSMSNTEMQMSNGAFRSSKALTAQLDACQLEHPQRTCLNWVCLKIWPSSSSWQSGHCRSHTDVSVLRTCMANTAFEAV